MNKNINTYNLNGKLELKEDVYEYILTDGNDEFNLTTILKSINKMVQPVVTMKIMARCRQVLEESGYFEQLLGKDSVMSYFIDGRNIDEFLFNRTGEYMNIYIEVEDMGAVK